MAHTTSTASRRQATIVIIGCAVLFVAFGIMVYSRFCTSIGMAGLYNRSAIGVSFVLFGIAMALFTPCVYLQRMHRKHVDSSQLGREMLGIVLGFLCYVVPFFLAMGALAPADSTGPFGIALTIAFGAIPFIYRRHRKQHPISYQHTGSAVLVAFCGVFALVSLVGGAYSCSEVIDDLNGGWRQETFAFYEFSIDQPSGRGAVLTPTTYEVALYKNGESVKHRRADARLSVNAADWPQVAAVLDEPMAEVRWYPKTRTLVGARGIVGRNHAGDTID